MAARILNNILFTYHTTLTFIKYRGLNLIVILSCINLYIIIKSVNNICEKKSIRFLLQRILLY